MYIDAKKPTADSDKYMIRRARIENTTDKIAATDNATAWNAPYDTRSKKKEGLKKFCPPKAFQTTKLIAIPVASETTAIRTYLAKFGHDAAIVTLTVRVTLRLTRPIESNRPPVRDDAENDRRARRPSWLHRPAPRGCRRRGRGGPWS
jgi:hypothetical protein